MVYNIQRTADAVRNTDLCALQECRGYLAGPVANQAQLLGELTNHAWLYEPSERRFWLHYLAACMIGLTGIHIDIRLTYD